MTNRLEMNWSLDGIVDEQRYYCSETPIDPLNLPVPKSVLAGAVRTYVDNVDMPMGRKKYIVFSSIKNLVEKVSPQALTYCLASQPKVWSEFKENLNDDFGTVWNSVNGATVAGGKLTISRVSDHRVETPMTDRFHFANSEDVTIRLKFKTKSAITSDRWVLLTSRIDSGFVKNWCVYLTPAGGIFFIIWRGDGTSALEYTWNSIFTVNEEVELSLERKDMTWCLYKNGNQVGVSQTQTVNYEKNNTGKFTIGSEFNAGGGNTRNLDGEISMFQILPLAIGGGGSTTTRI